MRLIDADALKSKIREQPWKRETKVSLILEWIYTLIDEASTVQNEALQQENEQLRAQVARMRELLTKAYDEIEKYKCLWKGSKPSGCDCPKPTALQDEIEQTLAEIDKAIGGKEDV